MSDEELNQKLKELEPLHNVGPKADEYLEFLEENKQKFKKDPSCWPTDSEIKKIINFDLLTDEQRSKAFDLAKTGYLAPTKYIHEITGMSLKCSKTYYDLYIYQKLI